MKDIKFLSITIRNFFSYGNSTTTVDLSTPGCTLISGVNMDDTSNGVGANGTGKSTILRAMLYLYANYVPEGMLVGDIVNNVNNKDCVIGGDLMVDGVRYTITKYRQSTEKPEKNYVEIFKDGDTTHNLAKGTSSEVSKQISTLIGIDPDMFRKIVMFDVNAVPFFAESGPAQRAIMEELFGLNDLMFKAEQMSERVKKVKAAMDEEQSLLNTKRALYDRYTGELDATSRKLVLWDERQRDNIDKLTQQISDLGTVDLNQLQEALSFNADIDKQVSDTVNDIKLRKLDLDVLKSRLDAIQAQIDSKTSSIKQMRNLLSKNESIITGHRANIKTLLTNFCPECNQQVDAVHSNQKIAELESAINSVEQSNGDVIQAIEKLENEVSNLNAGRDEISADLAHKEGSLVPLSRKIVELNKMKKPAKTQSEIDQLKTIESRLLASLESERAACNPYGSILQELQQNPVEVPDYGKINNLNNQLNHEQFMYKLLTDKKSFIRKYLIDKRLSPLNKQIHHYLQRLGLPHTAIFNNDLTVTIAKMGRPISYGGLSGGQKARLNFAVCLAFRDLLQLSNQVVPFLMVDEVLDHGLDDVGVQLASSVIHTIAKEQKCSIFLITHKSEIINRFPQRITVEMRHGFSNIRRDEE